MEEENVLLTKSFSLAADIVRLADDLTSKRAFVLADQILRSGTSIGANAEEAVGGISHRDFFAKLTISYKEARETKYWLRLFRETEKISDSLAEKLLFKVEELLKIIGSIQVTMRKRYPRK
jgi:four helix bundle protein